MDWMNQIGGLLQNYAGGGQGQVLATVHDDWDQVAQNVPPATLANGLAAAFRSDQTPPFAQMAGQLFSQSNGTQRAGLLNTIIGAIGPAVAGQVLSGGGGGLGNLGALAGLLGGGGGQVTPQMAEQVPPEAFQQLAAHAEQHNPSIIDEVSHMAAQNPGLVKSLGGPVLSMALGHLAQGL